MSVRDGDLSWLPDLVTLDQYGGDWGVYLDVLYEGFCEDFIHSRPRDFRGKPFRLKRHPMFEGKEATFWHFISEGKIESERLPDLRRCERLRWPRAMIDVADTAQVRVWEQQGRREPRVAIALPDFSYLVIVTERSDYVLPWTAFYVQYAHRRDTLRREYEASSQPPNN